MNTHLIELQTLYQDFSNRFGKDDSAALALLWQIEAMQTSSTPDLTFERRTQHPTGRIWLRGMNAKNHRSNNDGSKSPIRGAPDRALRQR